MLGKSQDSNIHRNWFDLAETKTEVAAHSCGTHGSGAYAARLRGCNIDADSAKSFGAKKVCDACGYAAKSWTGLVNHYNKEHNASFADMADHFIYAQATAEQARGRAAYTPQQCVQPLGTAISLWAPTVSSRLWCILVHPVSQDIALYTNSLGLAQHPNQKSCALEEQWFQYTSKSA